MMLWVMNELLDDGMCVMLAGEVALYEGGVWVCYSEGCCCLMKV